MWFTQGRPAWAIVVPLGSVPSRVHWTQTWGQSAAVSREKCFSSLSAGLPIGNTTLPSLTSTALSQWHGTNCDCPKGQLNLVQPHSVLQFPQSQVIRHPTAVLRLWFSLHFPAYTLHSTECNLLFPKCLNINQETVHSLIWASYKESIH